MHQRNCQLWRKCLKICHRKKATRNCLENFFASRNFGFPCFSLRSNEMPYRLDILAFMNVNGTAGLGFVPLFDSLIRMQQMALPLVTLVTRAVFIYFWCPRFHPQHSSHTRYLPSFLLFQICICIHMYSLPDFALLPTRIC